MFLSLLCLKALPDRRPSRTTSTTSSCRSSGWIPTDNYDTWNAFFANRRERELARYDGEGPPLVNHNEAGRRLWWANRTIIGVMRYIAGETILSYGAHKSTRHKPHTVPAVAASSSRRPLSHPP